MTYSKLEFPKFKKFVSRSVFQELQLMQILLNSQTSCCKLKIRGLGTKLCVAFLLLLFWKKLWHLKPHSLCFLLNKNMNFNKNERGSKMKNPTVLERWTLNFSLYKNCKLKEKLRWVWAHKGKVHFFNIYFAQRKFFQYLCFTSICSVSNKFPEYIYFYI